MAPTKLKKVPQSSKKRFRSYRISKNELESSQGGYNLSERSFSWWGRIWSWLVQFSSVQLLSRVQPFVTPWTVALQASLSFTSPGACSNSRPLSQWYHSSISPSAVPFSTCLQSFQHRVFSNESALLIKWPKYRKPRDKSTHLWTPYLWQRRQEYTMD